jgi:hypothetical protein
LTHKKKGITCLDYVNIEITPLGTTRGATRHFSVLFKGEGNSNMGGFGVNQSKQEAGTGGLAADGYYGPARFVYRETGPATAQTGQTTQNPKAFYIVDFRQKCPLSVFPRR